MRTIEKVVNYLRTSYRPYVVAAAAFAIFEFALSFYSIDSLNLRLALEWLAANPSYFYAIWPYLAELFGRAMLMVLWATVFSVLVWIFATHRKDLEFNERSIVMLSLSFLMIGFAFGFAGLFSLPTLLLATPGAALCLLETWRMRVMAQTY